MRNDLVSLSFMIFAQNKHETPEFFLVFSFAVNKVDAVNDAV